MSWSFIPRSAERESDDIQKPIYGINFVLVNDRKMATLHREFSKISGTTDVLTFELSPDGKSVDGEIIICYDQAKRQAVDFGVPLFEEVARLAVHGVLHLAGYDDRTAAERDTMRKLEDRFLKAGRKAA
jgi:rRNA maturation RNase YbeY